MIDGASIREHHQQVADPQKVADQKKIEGHIKQNQKSNQQTQVRQVEKIQDPKQSPRERPRQSPVYQSIDPKDQVKRIKRVIIEIIKRYMGNNYTIILDRRYNTINFHSEDIADLKLIGPNGQKL